MDSQSQTAITLKQKHADAIKDAAPKAEKDGKPGRAQMSALNEQNLLMMLAPAAYGGLQLSVIEAMQLCEQLAEADGSIGWLAANSALAGWASGFIHGDVAGDLSKNEKYFMATSADTGGTAEKTRNGYTVTGKWDHVPGIGDAVAFISNCTITENGKNITDDNGKTQVLTFILPKSELTLTGWSPAGLAGTGSQHVTVNNLKVPAERAFIMNGEHAMNNNRLYQYPYLQLAEALLSATVYGMAARFTALCTAIIDDMKDERGNPLMQDNMVQDTVSKYTQKMNDAKVKLYYAAELTWQACVNQQTIKDTILYKVSAAAQDLTRKSRECADALYPFCGMAAMDKTTELNRVWRDLHTASQERVLVFGGL